MEITFAQKQKTIQEVRSKNPAEFYRASSGSAPETSRIQRACACGGGCPTCVNKHDDAGEHPFAIQKKSLEISNPTDADEIEADEIARKVVDGQSGEIRESSAAVNRSGENSAEISAEFRSKLESSKSGGQSLDDSTRTEMESKMGADFSSVKIHTGGEAHKMSEDISAKAFTHGQDIFFTRGQFNTSSKQGKELLAHELAHTVQQSASKVKLKIQRDKASTATKDPLCDTFDFNVTKLLVATQAKDLKADPKIAQQHALIRTLKLIRRCASPEQQTEIQNDLAGVLDAATSKSVWGEAGTAFGGYTGMYPGYASDIKTHLTKLGVSDTVSFGTFPINYGAAGSRTSASAVASREIPDLARTDIVYFRGHQFAQYQAPGVFTDGEIEAGFDLRYINKKGGFPNVKLMISTSCATLCKESYELFHSLFPNAVILGFRKSAPINGAKVRDDFQSKIKSLSRPLLLEQSIDINAIIFTWKSVIESNFAGQTASLPGYYDGKLNYWDGKAWQVIDPMIEGNKCKLKGDDSTTFPAP